MKYSCNYFFAESAFALVVSCAGVLAKAESEGAGALTIAESEGVVVSVEVVLPPHAVRNAATVKTSNNFFILF